MTSIFKNITNLFFTLLTIATVISCSKLKKHPNYTHTNNFNITADSLIWNVEELYKAPNFRIVDSSNVYSIVYENIKFNDTLREVFAYYSNPALLKGVQQPNKKYPGIVLAHGGGGRAFKEWVKMWAAKGYAAIAYDMSARDGLDFFKQKPGPKATNQTKFMDVEKGLKNTWSYFAVASTIKAHSLLLSRPEVDKNKTAITGISWGGYITCMAAGLDHRFKAACPVYGCGFYNGMEQPNKQFSFLSQKNVNLWMNNLDPQHYLPNVRCPIFFMNGNKDIFFDFIPYKKSYDLVNSSLKNISIIPNMRHSHKYGWAPLEIETFMDQILNNKKPLAKIDTPVINNNVITAIFESATEVKSCELWYSNDTISRNINRTWNVTKANFANNKITVNNPNNKMLFGFIRLIDNRNLSVSSEIFYQKN